MSGASGRPNLENGRVAHQLGGSDFAAMSSQYLLPHGWRRAMAFGKTTRLGVFTAALALGGTAIIGFAPEPNVLPTVTVWHNPT